MLVLLISIALIFVISTVHSFIITTCPPVSNKPYHVSLLYASSASPPSTNNKKQESIVKSIITKQNENKKKSLSSASSKSTKHELILSALRRTAAISSNLGQDIPETTTTRNNDRVTKVTTVGAATDIPKLSHELKKNSSSVIHSTIHSLLQKRQQQQRKEERTTAPSTTSYSMGLFGEKIPIKTTAAPPKILIHPNTPWGKSNKPTNTISDLYKVRTSIIEDNENIANLRLSVFSTVITAPLSGLQQYEQRQYFQKRSCEVLNNRRNLGAICLVVTIPNMFSGLLRSISQNSNYSNTSGKGGGNSSCNIKQYVSKRWMDGVTKEDLDFESVIGSLECSFHEFENTLLGASQPKGKLMYITEVAVSPAARRCGIGTKLLQGMEELAKQQKIKTMYLHVEATNKNALNMYQNNGFQVLNSKHDTKHTEFTHKLHLHDGAIRGKYYYLMSKHFEYKDDTSFCGNQKGLNRLIGDNVGGIPIGIRSDFWYDDVE